MTNRTDESLATIAAELRKANEIMALKIMIYAGVIDDSKIMERLDKIMED